MKVLITGGSGLIGKALTEKLLLEGHQVNILTRSFSDFSKAKEFLWTKNWADEKAFDQVDVLVHLAGAGIADKRWTSKRKAEIISSRVDSLNLLQKYVSQTKINTLIGGSAIGFYGGDTGEILNDENTLAGSDFMADCCIKWEKAEEDFAEKFKIRLVKIRTGIVLDKNGGALPKMAGPIKWFIGSSFGSGQQWMSWIHIDDIVEMFFQSITNPQISGVINGVAPYPVRNQDFTNIAAKVLNRKIILPNIPSIVLKIALGEMSTVILGSSKVDNRKPLLFKLKFEKLKDALKELL